MIGPCLDGESLAGDWPRGSSGTSDVWYKYTPAASGTVTVDTCTAADGLTPRLLLSWNL